MKVVSSISELRESVAALRAAERRIAFVPTMGNLHDGHLRLVQRAGNLADAVVASIYVNPLQFGPQEDLATYPRTPQEDRAALAHAGTALLFMPGDAEMYPRGAGAMTRVEVPELSDMLCGAFRPGHFRGVATVVARLLNLVQPHVAVFGKKDYQQWRVIERMVADLGMPVDIEGVDTVREADGLALSSRNQYLRTEERAQAPRLYAVLREAAAAVQAGRGTSVAEDEARSALEAAGFRPDYISVRRQADLGVPQDGDRELVALVAAWLGRTRLIDNLEFSRTAV